MLKALSLLAFIVHVPGCVFLLLQFALAAIINAQELFGSEQLFISQ